MKIRTGFVSNSSSTSYVIALNEIPTTIDECKKTFGCCYQEQAEIIFKQLQETHSIIKDPETRSEILEFIGNPVYLSEDPTKTDLVNMFMRLTIGKHLAMFKFCDESYPSPEADLRCQFRNLISRNENVAEKFQTDD